MQTMYIKDYPNCVLNGTNKKVRASSNPLRDLYTKTQVALKRLNPVNEIVVVMLADRISTEASFTAHEINKNKKYLIRVSNKQQVPVRIVLRTYKEFIYNTILIEHGLHWNHTKNVNNKILNISDYSKGSLTFEKWSNNKMLGYWKSHELLPF